MAVFDEVAKLLRAVGGLRGKDLRAKEFISSGAERPLGKIRLGFTWLETSKIYVMRCN